MSESRPGRGLAGSPHSSDDSAVARLRVWAARHASGLTVAGLLCLPYVMFLGQTLGVSLFYFHDIQFYFFPYRKVAVDILLSGHLPLWNPFANAGMPLIGDGQTALFYPPNWLMLVFGPAHGLTLAILSTFGIAAAGMFVYLREVRFARWIAAIMGFAFGFCGFFTAHLVHVSIPATAAWVPWIFWGVERAMRPNRSRRARDIVLAALPVAFQAMAGHPQIPVYCAVSVGLYVLVIVTWGCVGARSGRPMAPLVRVAAIYALGAALAAIQLVPWAELSRLSPRAAKTPFELFASFDLADTDWLLFLFPYSYGGLRSSWMQSLDNVDLGLVVQMWERMPYVGLLPLALAAVGVLGTFPGLRAGATPSSAVRRRSRPVALLIVLVAMLLLAAGGSTPVGRVVHALPLLGQLRGQARATALTSFVLVVLASYGLGVLTVRRPTYQRAIRASTRVVLLTGATLLALILGALTFGNIASLGSLTDTAQVVFGLFLRIGNANAWVPLALGCASVCVLIWLTRRPASRLARTVMVIVLAVDLGGFALTFNPTTEPAVFRRVPPSVEFLRKDPESFRVAVFLGTDRVAPEVAQDQLAISWAMAYGFEDINGFNSLQPRRLVEFLFDWPFLKQKNDVSYGGLPAPLLAEPMNRVLTMLGVRYAMLQKPFKWAGSPSWRIVHGTDNVLIARQGGDSPRAYFADLVLRRDDPKRVLELVHDPGFDPTRFAVVEGDLGGENPERLGGGAGSVGKVSFQRASPNEVRLQVEAPSRRLLVVSEMAFPGWEAEIRAGDVWLPMPMYTTNYLFRGLIVPQGPSTIRMVYRPRSVLIGATVTLAAVLACGALWYIGGKVRQPARKQPPLHAHAGAAVT